MSRNPVRSSSHQQKQAGKADRPEPVLVLGVHPHHQVALHVCDDAMTREQKRPAMFIVYCSSFIVCDDANTVLDRGHEMQGEGSKAKRDEPGESRKKKKAKRATHTKRNK